MNLYASSWGGSLKKNALIIAYYREKSNRKLQSGVYPFFAGTMYLASFLAPQCTLSAVQSRYYWRVGDGAFFVICKTHFIASRHSAEGLFFFAGLPSRKVVDFTFPPPVMCFEGPVPTESILPTPRSKPDQQPL